jgi:hypothetical protein
MADDMESLPANQRKAEAPPPAVATDAISDWVDA